MKSICSFNIDAMPHCNIMPCVNAAYDKFDNHMEWKNPCAIYPDLVYEMYANIRWGTTLIGPIFQTTFLKAFSWMKTYKSR